MTEVQEYLLRGFNVGLVRVSTFRTSRDEAQVANF